MHSLGWTNTGPFFITWCHKAFCLKLVLPIDLNIHSDCRRRLQKHIRRNSECFVFFSSCGFISVLYLVAWLIPIIRGLCSFLIRVLLREGYICSSSQSALTQRSCKSTLCLHSLRQKILHIDFCFHDSVTIPTKIMMNTEEGHFPQCVLAVVRPLKHPFSLDCLDSHNLHMSASQAK